FRLHAAEAAGSVPVHRQRLDCRAAQRRLRLQRRDHPGRLLVLGTADRDGAAGMTVTSKGGGVAAEKRRGLSGLLQLANDGSLAVIKRLLRDTGRAFAPRYALVLGLGA